MKRLKLFIPLVVFVALIPFFIIAMNSGPSELESQLIGKPLPEFSLPALKQKKVYVREDLIGEPFLLNVWATWCPTCIHEHPYLMALAEQGVKIVGLNYKDEDPKALEWLDRLGDPYVVNIVDKNGRLAIPLGVYGAPETYIVDREGIIRHRHAGDLNERNWKGELAPIFFSL